eukprot:6488651-Amphidinium_carterae.1
MSTPHKFAALCKHKPDKRDKKPADQRVELHLSQQQLDHLAFSLDLQLQPLCLKAASTAEPHRSTRKPIATSARTTIDECLTRQEPQSEHKRLDRLRIVFVGQTALTV